MHRSASRERAEIVKQREAWLREFREREAKLSEELQRGSLPLRDVIFEMTTAVELQGKS